MIDENAIQETQRSAHQDLRTGLDEIGRAQLNLFAFIEKLGSHVVALEALTTQLLKGRDVPVEEVHASIAARLEENGLPADCAGYATQVVDTLIASSR